MIPAFNHSHVLPPFEGDRLNSAQSSPYKATVDELVRRFATSPERSSILDGLFRYRAELRKHGFVKGFQWLDGSFVEDVETRDGRPPGDIDLVTFAYPPEGSSNAEIGHLFATVDLFNRERCKENYRCDTTIVNLTTSPEWLVTQSRFWYGLYSHRRGDALWKGMLELPLDCDDATAQSVLSQLLHQGDLDAGST